MKQEFDKEMDALLRTHVRQATPRAATITAHLDADELNAYAEHAVPPLARARYAAHLADCDDCRAQVVVLARAAGLADRFAEHGAVVAPLLTPSWRERLAAWFAPGAWRYAMPFVALLLVSGVVFWVMSGARRERASTAQAPAQIAASRPNAEAEQNHAGSQPPPQGDPNALGGLIAATNDNSAPPHAESNDAAKANAPRTADAPRELIARNEPPPTAVGAGAGAPAPPPQPTPAQNYNISTGVNQNAAVNQTSTSTLNAERGLNSQNVQQQPSVAPGYAPEPAANARPALAANKEQQERAQPKAPATRTADRGRDEDDRVAADRREAKRDTEGTRGGGREDERVHGPQRGMSASRARGPAKDKGAPKDEESARGERRREKTNEDRSAASEAPGEATRTVGGREFRRQSGAWVDTTYRAGQATTVVHRDSEQWRALAADEPGLRRIADELGGEVVIIWRGRAYRIKP